MKGNKIKSENNEENQKGKLKDLGIEKSFAIKSEQNQSIFSIEETQKFKPDSNSTDKTSQNVLEKKKEGIPNQCEMCHKTFVNIKLLMTHVKAVHNKKRQLVKCETCGKSIQKYYLKRHIQKIHNNAKAQKCDLCNKTFNSENYLELHVKTVHYTVV